MSRVFVPIIPRAIISVITRVELRDIVDAFQIDRCRDKGDLSRATRATSLGRARNEKAKEKKRKEKKRRKREHYERAVFMHMHRI